MSRILIDEILVSINNRFKELDPELPFPQRTVYHRLEERTRDYLIKLAGDRAGDDYWREATEVPLRDG